MTFFCVALFPTVFFQTFFFFAELWASSKLSECETIGANWPENLVYKFGLKMCLEFRLKFGLEFGIKMFLQFGLKICL